MTGFHESEHCRDSFDRSSTSHTPALLNDHKCREIGLPPPICSAFHKRSSGSASLLRHERVIRPRLRSPSLSNGNSPLRRNRRSGSRHIPQSPFSGPKRLADGLFVISTFWELSFSAAISIPATKWMPTWTSASRECSRRRHTGARDEKARRNCRA